MKHEAGTTSEADGTPPSRPAVPPIFCNCTGRDGGRTLLLRGKKLCPHPGKWSLYMGDRCPGWGHSVLPIRSIFVPHPYRCSGSIWGLAVLDGGDSTIRFRNSSGLVFHFCNNFFAVPRKYMTLYVFEKISPRAF